MLFRVARRITAWEGGIPVEEVQKIEFSLPGGGPDLDLSTYDLDDTAEHHTQAWAEHLVRLDPKKGGGLLICVANVDCVAEKTLGESPFAFSRDRHHELRVPDESKLKQVIALLTAERHRQRPVTNEAAQAYVSSRLSAADPEWKAELQKTPKKWLANLGKAIVSSP